MKKLLVLNDKSFSKEVLEPNVPVLVDFWASWCPPCKMVEPILEEIARAYGQRVKIGKINVDQNPYMATAYTISGVPTFIVFDGGREVVRRIGSQSKKQLCSMIEGSMTATREAMRG